MPALWLCVKKYQKWRAYRRWIIITLCLCSSDRTPHSRLYLFHTLESAPADLGLLSSFPTIQYSLYYDIQRNILSVHLQQMYNLPTRHKDRPIDSFVCLYLMPHKEQEFESKLVQKSLNPVFGQDFEFTSQPGLELAREQVLIFKIMERSK